MFVEDPSAFGDQLAALPARQLGPILLGADSRVDREVDIVGFRFGRAATCSPVAGLVTAKVLPDLAGTRAASMRSLLESSDASACGSSTG